MFDQVHLVHIEGTGMPSVEAFHHYRDAVERLVNLAKMVLNASSDKLGRLEKPIHEKDIAGIAVGRPSDTRIKSVQNIFRAATPNTVRIETLPIIGKWSHPEGAGDWEIVWTPSKNRPVGGSYSVFNRETGETDGPYLGGAQASGHPDFREMVHQRRES